MNPKMVLAVKTVLWLIIVSIIMLFAGFTSGYIVRQAEANWLYFKLPQAFTFSTIIISLSSATMFWAKRAIDKNDRNAFTKGLTLTLLLGIGFCSTQYFAWSELVRMGIFFTGNPSGSFLYVLTAVHLLHLAAGIIFLAIVTALSYKGYFSSQNQLAIQLCSTYWHFLGGLWVYLFIFLSMLR